MSSFSKTLLKKIQEELDDLQDIFTLIDQSIVSEPPISIKEGGLIQDGVNESIDHFRKAKTEGKTWLAQLENEDRERTGIKNLKIKYNKVYQI